MGSFSNYIENELLDHLFGKGAYTPPTIYLALSTADPTDDASGLAEPSGSGYARLVTAGGDWNAAVSGVITNNGALSFAEATGAWGTITHFALFDALSGGNMLAHGQLDVAKAVTSGDVVRFPDDAIEVSLD